MVCYRARHRPRFFFKLHIWHGRRGEPKTFSWRQYRDLIAMTHIQLGTPVVWCWDNLNVHLVKELADYAEEHKDRLRIFQMPSYAPELNPAEGIWSLLKRHLADFAATDLAHLTRVVKRKLKKIQYRPHLTDGCLPPTGLIMDDDATRSSDSTSSTWVNTPVAL
nr:transposase [Streptomyces sp. NRRL S-813]